MMEIYFILQEYEIVTLITLDKEVWEEQLRRIAREDGSLEPGDLAEVWKGNKKLYYVDKLQDIR